MATKSLRNSDQAVLCTYSQYGEIVSSSTRIAQDRATADAIFKRARPSPLTDTPFQVVERLENPGIYTSGDPAVFYRRGLITYAYTSEVPKSVVLEEDGLFLLNRARHKISGRDQDLGESLVELDQTIDLIQKNLKRLGDIGSALKSGEWSKLDSLIKGKTPNSVKNQRPSKRLASGYLEIMFGVLPLMSSVHTAVNAYGNGILTRGSTVSARSGQKRADLSKGVDRAAMSNLGRASFRGTVKNENVATLNSYGLINPALMAYQRLPYSFVIDWFVPIGPILGSLTAEAGLSDVRQTYTSVRYVEQTMKAGYVSRNIRYNRKVPGLLPPIGSPFGRPAQLSIGKLISSIALIRQRFP